jgi:hypothetical protein
MGSSPATETLPLEQVFTPAEPVRNRRRFHGRAVQLERAARVLTEPGRHLLILGGRGVGRTSFALTAAADHLIRYHAAGLGDSFQQIVRRLLGGAVAEGTSADDAAAESTAAEGTAAGPSMEDPGAPDPWALVRRTGAPTVLIIDDLDRASPEAVSHGIAPLLRALSDSSSRSKTILITRRDLPFPQELSGVGLRLHALVLDRLDEESLHELVERGAKNCGLRFALELRQRIVLDAEGLPGLVHALALEAGRSARQAGRKTATLARDYLPALQGLVSSLEPSLAARYEAATAGRSRRNRYAHLLWAAALCSEGRFGLPELERGLERIEGRAVPPQAFAVHLGDLLKRDLLVRLREGRYRFADPALRAYVRLLLRRDHPALMGDDPLQLTLPY